MKKKRDGRLPLSGVPPLGVICDALGFRNSKDRKDFTDFTHEWRNTYTTVDNLPGSDLVELNCPKTRDNLATMSKTFLDKAGRTYWPYLNGPEDKLCFPNDEKRLIDLLTQLFWRQNRYAANNKKYARDKSARDPFRHTPYRPSSLAPLENTAPSIPVRSVADTQSIVNAVMDESAPQVPDAKNSEMITSIGSRRLPQASRPYIRRSLQHQSPTALSSVPTPPVVSNRISSRNPHQIRFSPPPEKLSSPVGPLAKASLPIPLHIVQHMGDITHQTLWENGRIGNKTLQEFLGDLAEKQKCRPEDIMMIRLVLRLGSLEINVDVGSGRDDTWEIMRGTFRDEIRRARMNGVDMGMINVQIEPLMTEVGELQWVGGEDEFEL